jgi:hypothetical protein
MEVVVKVKDESSNGTMIKAELATHLQIPKRQFTCRVLQYTYAAELNSP